MTRRTALLALACSVFLHSTSVSAQDPKKTFTEKVHSCATREAVDEYFTRVLRKKEQPFRVMRDINTRAQWRVCDFAVTVFTVEGVIETKMHQSTSFEFIKIQVKQMMMPVPGISGIRTLIDTKQERFMIVALRGHEI